MGEKKKKKRGAVREKKIKERKGWTLVTDIYPPIPVCVHLEQKKRGEVMMEERKEGKRTPPTGLQFFFPNTFTYMPNLEAFQGGRGEEGEKGGGGKRRRGEKKEGKRSSPLPAFDPPDEHREGREEGKKEKRPKRKGEEGRRHPVLT